MEKEYNYDIIYITGFLQKNIFLNNKNKKIFYIDYHKYKIYNLIQKYKNKKLNGKIIISFSLGVKIALYLINLKIINGKELILISPFYKYYSNISSNISNISLNRYKSFKKLIIKDSNKFYKSFTESIYNINNKENNKFLMNEINFKYNSLYLDKLFNLKKDNNFNFLYKFNKIYILHGKNDNITNYKQSKIIYSKLKNKKILFIIKNSGHFLFLSNYIIYNIIKRII